MADRSKRRSFAGLLYLCLLVAASLLLTGFGPAAHAAFAEQDSSKTEDDNIMSVLREVFDKLDLSACSDVERARDTLKSPEAKSLRELKPESLKESLKRLYEKLPRGFRRNPSGESYQLLFLGYLRIEDGKLDSPDRFIRELAGLRYALYSKPFSRCPQQALTFMGERFTNCALLARQMDPRAAAPVIENLVMTAAETAVRNPNLGLTLGRWLETVLTAGLQACGTSSTEHVEERKRLEAMRRSMIEFDGADITAPSFFYAADVEIHTALSTKDDVIDRIEALAQIGTWIKDQLETGARYLHDRSSVWVPFMKYSNILMDLYQESDGLPVDRCVRARLATAAAASLRRGIQLYLEDPRGLAGRDDALKDARKALFERIAIHLDSLKKDFDYQGMADFAEEFAKNPEVFEAADFAQLSAEAARACCLVGRAYESYLKNSAKRVDYKELKKLKDTLGPYISLGNTKSCPLTDW